MRMRIVPKPPANSRLVFFADRAPIARGFGIARFECGACGDLLLADFRASDIRCAVFRCPTCGAYNEPAAEIDAGEPIPSPV